MSTAVLGQAVRLHQAGKLDEAALLYRTVLQTDPRNFQALYLLGYVHFQKEQYLEAESLMGDAIAMNPRQPDAYYNRGCALQKLRREDEARLCFERATALKPDYAEAHFNCGASLLNLGRYADAVTRFDAALRLTPQDAEGWFNRGVALQNLGRIAEARASYDRAVSLQPQLPQLLGKRIYATLQLCDWSSFDSDRARAIAATRSGHLASGPLEMMMISDSPAEISRSARLLVERVYPPAVAPHWRGERYEHERIRIAYISPDFRGHAVAFQLAGVIEHHDRSRFEIFGISHGIDDNSALRARLKRGFDHFLDVRGRSDTEIATLLRQHEIDIAVDLAGHTLDARISILAERPAPVQVSYLGFAGSPGAPFNDYLIADRIVVPDTERAHYGESIAYLPDCFFPTDDARHIGDPPSRATAGLPESGFVLCCFNPICKLTPEIFDVWMRLLERTSGSVLWLPAQSEQTRANLARAAQLRGVSPDRLVFAPRVPDADAHLARLALADLFLDTWPYNAHATASDALWMGVPVVTYAGRSFASRVAASLLRAAGLPELVTESMADYEASALRLAGNSDMLWTLRERLDENRRTTPLFKTTQYTRALETLFAAMWERSRRGEAPADIG
jgi:predicted O-linked N-acetylglucosamine transferase (SPINDLY family)